MHISESAWEKRRAPYDPRLVDGVIITEDEHGRIVETADCGIRCLGCGVCCQGNRDVVTAGYGGVEDFDPNHGSSFKPGRIVKLGENGIYFTVSKKIC